MTIKITTPDKKEYILSEGLYAIDGTWLYEDNQLTGRVNVALLENCKIDIDLEKKHQAKFDLEKYLYSQVKKILQDPLSDESVEITETLEKYFTKKVVAKALTDVVFDKLDKKQ